jgi:DNA polymerase-3 subunit delta'
MSFRDVVGHQRLIALLSRSISRDSLLPSLIFAGPGGIGKRLVADAVAQAVNCLNPQRRSSSSSGESGGIPYDACGVCSACSRIARHIHADLVIVQPDNGLIRIEPVRDLIERTGYRPFEGRRRVAIIDGADAMMTTAQNALLKTLEEPPSASILVLVTAHPDMLLPTVRSRCPLLRFQPLDPREVETLLVRHGKSDSAARTLAAAAGGSVGDALVSSESGLKEMRDAALRVLVGAASGDDLRRRIEGAKDLVAKSGTAGASDREYLSTCLRLMTSLVRDAGLLAAGAPGGDLANRELEHTLTRLTVFRGERCVKAYDAIGRGLAALDRNRNANPKIVADWVSLNL